MSGACYLHRQADGLTLTFCALDRVKRKHYDLIAAVTNIHKEYLCYG